MTGPGTRELLVDAARDLLAREGIEAVSLREIARRAGVSHGAPLRHFPSLAALLSRVSADGFRGLVTTIDDTIAGDAATDAVGRLRAAGRGYVRFALGDPGAFALMFRPERCDRTDPELAVAGAAAFGQLVGLVAAAQAEGWYPDLPTLELAASVWASVHGLASLWLDGALAPATTDDTIDRLLALHLDRVTATDHTASRAIDPAPHPEDLP